MMNAPRYNAGGYIPPPAATPVRLEVGEEIVDRYGDVVAVVGCTCPNGDTWACIDGTVYGPCSSERCGGVCTTDGRCDCTATKHIPGRHETPRRIPGSRDR